LVWLTVTLLLVAKWLFRFGLYIRGPTTLVPRDRLCAFPCWLSLGLGLGLGVCVFVLLGLALGLALGLLLAD
jgi:hypothetical protein